MASKLVATVGVDGKLCTGVDEVDRAARDHWGTIYQGNFADEASGVARYLAKFGQFVVRRSTFDVPSLTGEALRQHLL
eukprot:7760657-Alexandrium_andersonii.AAC.1